MPSACIHTSSSVIHYHFNVKMWRWHSVSNPSSSFIGIVKCNWSTIEHNESDEIIDRSTTFCQYRPRKRIYSISQCYKYARSDIVRISFVEWNLIKDHNLVLVLVSENWKTMMFVLTVINEKKTVNTSCIRHHDFKRTLVCKFLKFILQMCSYLCSARLNTPVL